MTAHTVEQLLAAMRGLPKLTGARCVGHSELWDNTDDDDVTAYTREQCLYRCPALQACRLWLDSLTPAHRPTGVVAGRIITKPRTRRTA